MKPFKPPIIFLLGPTASGKTDWAIAWQKLFNRIEIISVDSVMVYQGCDIGSAKPTKAILAKHPHYLVDEIELDQIFSVADFCHSTHQLIEDIHSRNNYPLLVGGSMMYFNVLKKGMSILPSADSNFRAALEMRIQDEGITSIHNELFTLDKEIASSIKPQDTQRIIRALEIIHLSSSDPQSNKNELTSAPLADKYTLHQYGIFPMERALLHSRIENRQHELIAGGLLKEVQELTEKYDLSSDHPAMKAVNYRQALMVINGELSEDDLFEKSLYATRQLAKRQCTWIRSWENLQTYDVDAFDQATKHLKKQLNFA
ncbi:tRNA (adenosine(37)-N6)-dimethylallyltransferase MiaA [Gammaproteobacteria bacterium]|nr:tRNA (adenosine(37)-N6)-dimethylallyltransferase MiaA [Gammaproteobacteria bacterium]